MEKPSGTFGSGGELAVFVRSENRFDDGNSVKQQARIARPESSCCELQRSDAMYRWSITWRRRLFSPSVLTTLERNCDATSTFHAVAQHALYVFHYLISAVSSVTLFCLALRP